MAGVWAVAVSVGPLEAWAAALVALAAVSGAAQVSVEVLAEELVAATV